jgi:hypothetical protein
MRKILILLVLGAFGVAMLPASSAKACANGAQTMTHHHHHHKHHKKG